MTINETVNVEPYVPPEPASAWRAAGVVEQSAEAELKSRSEALKSDDSVVHDRAIRLVSRVAAIETGAIEQLYTTNRGITFTVATEAAMVSAAFAQASADTHQLIESQLTAYEHVLDFATGNRPIAQAWIRELHKILCGAQKTYRVYAGDVAEDRPLEHGNYKTMPNHVHISPSVLHEYAPPEQVAAEMQRLCDEIASDEFAALPPVIQAAFVHHFIAAVHPFSDGNGRVARAISSVFLYRAYRIPLLVLSDERDGYFDVLSRADRMDYRPITELVARATRSALAFVEQSLRAGSLPEIPEQIADIAKLYRSQAGVTHDDVDRAGYQLLERLEQDLREVLGVYSGATGNGIQLGMIIVRENGTQDPSDPKTHRNIMAQGSKRVRVRVTTPKPGESMVEELFFIHVPRVPDAHSLLILRGATLGYKVEFPLLNVVPRVSMAEEIKLRLFVERAARSLLTLSQTATRKQLQSNGYLA